ncbi:MAG: DUF4124 domain-containing protein [Nitrospirota bacterium]
MRVRRESYARGLSTATIGVGLACLASFAGAGEFYSWTDASGIMVMTDDSSRIPPATVRSPVAVHRFQDSRPSPSQPQESVRVLSSPAASEPAESSSANQKESQQPAKREPVPVNPADLDLPQVLLEAPGETVRTQYLWVPLLAPIYLGSSSVSGFWHHRNVSSPVEAFKHFLRQHPQQLQSIQAGTGGSQWTSGGVLTGPKAPSNPVYNSGNYVYDQVMRERHALSERIASQFRPAPQAPRVGSAPSGSNR